MPLICCLSLPVSSPTFSCALPAISLTAPFTWSLFIEPPVGSTKLASQLRRKHSSERLEVTNRRVCCRPRACFPIPYRNRSGRIRFASRRRCTRQDAETLRIAGVRLHCRRQRAAIPIATPDRGRPPILLRIPNPLGAIPSVQHTRLQRARFSSHEL